MTATHQIPSALLTLALLLAGSSEARPQDSPEPTERPTQTERRVTILRSKGEPRIDLEAVSSPRGFLGVGLLELTPELREHFGVPKDRGIMISSIVPDSPAERAGLRPADILTAADGEFLPASIDLSIRVARAVEGAELALERWRDGRKEVLRVPIELRARSQVDIAPLILHRIAVDGGHRIEFRGEGIGDAGNLWVERVIDTVGESFSEETFIQQLEALRRERAALLEKLSQMEARLKALESDLHRLDSDHR